MKIFVIYFVNFILMNIFIFNRSIFAMNIQEKFYTKSRNNPITQPINNKTINPENKCFFETLKTKKNRFKFPPLHIVNNSQFTQDSDEQQNDIVGQQIKNCTADPQYSNCSSLKFQYQSSKNLDYIHDYINCNNCDENISSSLSDSLEAVKRSHEKLVTSDMESVINSSHTGQEEEEKQLEKFSSIKSTPHNSLQSYSSSYSYEEKPINSNKINNNQEQHINPYKQGNHLSSFENSLQNYHSLHSYQEQHINHEKNNNNQEQLVNPHGQENNNGPIDEQKNL